ncbi:hypothetical protein NEMIN01_2116 [Nematocida minor]|uniref:uncharacterized protein n=1 Tax=Nematocida minor TaxID=1912983 RepID=UPI00221F53E7|nr:uncharacterized protein NEMIN01_2116 [Nematocida minor]KAI5192617.1 hypothetical protein NEMIN01_2116 [Nematocida minor]
MTVREVKLRIYLQKIVNAYTARVEKLLRLDIRKNKKMDQFMLLNDILKENVTIESDHYTSKEKRLILGIIKNRIYQYFVYNDKLGTMNTLYLTLRPGTAESIKYEAADIIRHMMGPNPLIYSLDDGMRIKNETSEDASPTNSSADINTRVYTLEIDDTKFSNLENIFQSTTDSLNNDNFHCISDLAESMGLNFLGKIYSILNYHDLYKLYNTPRRESDMLFVDYGLKLMCEHYYDLKYMVKKKKTKIKCIDKNNKSLSEDDLHLIGSIIKNIEKIKHEKKIHNYLFKVLNYLAKNTDVLKAKDGSNTIKIDTDLSKFYDNYIANSPHFKNILDDAKEDKLAEKLKKKLEFLNVEKNIEKEKALHKQLNEASSSSYSAHPNKGSVFDAFGANPLQGKSEEYLECENVQELVASLKSLSKLSRIQHYYLSKKIKLFEKMQNIRLAEEKKIKEEEKKKEVTLIQIEEEAQPASAEPTARKLSVGTLLMGGIALTGATVLSHSYYQPKGEAMNASDNSHLYDLLDSTQLRSMNNPNIS